MKTLAGRVALKEEVTANLKGTRVYAELMAACLTLNLMLEDSGTSSKHAKSLQESFDHYDELKEALKQDRERWDSCQESYAAAQTAAKGRLFDMCTERLQARVHEELALGRIGRSTATPSDIDSVTFKELWYVVNNLRSLEKSTERGLLERWCSREDHENMTQLNSWVVSLRRAHRRLVDLGETQPLCSILDHVRHFLSESERPEFKYVAARLMGTAIEDLTLEQLTLCIKEVEHNQVRSIVHQPLYQTQKSKSEEVHRDEKQSGVIAKGGVRDARPYGGFVKGGAAFAVTAGGAERADSRQAKLPRPPL